MKDGTFREGEHFVVGREEEFGKVRPASRGVEVLLSIKLVVEKLKLVAEGGTYAVWLRVCTWWYYEET